MYRPNRRSDSYGWLCTSYHEAGHAVAVLLLGRRLLSVEVISESEGATWTEHTRSEFIGMVDRANAECRVHAHLLQYWLDEFWISDAGSIAEEEFNLVPKDELARGSLGDTMLKFSLIPNFKEDTFLEGYYYRYVGAWMSQITEACRLFFRKPRVSALTRTLAEALLRSRRLGGDEVIDTLLSNRAALTGQMDMFWTPCGEDPFVRRQAMRSPVQLSMVGLGPCC